MRWPHGNVPEESCARANCQTAAPCDAHHSDPPNKMVWCPTLAGVFDHSWRRFMAGLKDRTGYGGGSQGSHEVEYLPLVADVLGWIGLFVCAIGLLLLLGEGLAALFSTRS